MWISDIIHKYLRSREGEYMKLGAEIGIDLGTATIMMYLKGKGIVLHEPSVVAVNQQTGRVLAVGKEAKVMIGRTPEVVAAVRPLRDGVISDFKVTEVMLKTFMERVNQGFLSGLFKPRVIVCIPSVVTPVEQKAVEDACKNAGAREVLLIKEPIAAAIGAGIDITRPYGSMIVDIGGGTTDIAVISMCEPVVDASLKVAGDRFDEMIVQFVKRKYQVLIGEKTAEILKIKIGCAYPLPEEKTMSVRGRNTVTGLPDNVVVSSMDILEALADPIGEIFEAVGQVLEGTPPELVGDLKERGLVLTGGGAKIYGLDQMLSTKLGVPVIVPEHPEACVALGTGRALSMIDQFHSFKRE